MNPVAIKFKKLRKEAVLPKFATKGSVCFDFYTCLDKSAYDYICIEPGEICLVPTGLTCEVPEGYELLIRPRSGISCIPILVANSPGTIDTDYRGEIKIIMYNPTKENFIVDQGDRVAQGAVRPVPNIEIIEVEELSATERGEGGFGSTGI